MKNYDIVVVGAGHAGCEAALAAARLGCSTALITTNISEVGKMPCNPAIGGPGKSQIVREIDALGGQMALVADSSMINIRLLNTSKGPAMRVRRAQADRVTYKLVWKNILENTSNLELIEGMAEDLVADNGQIAGVNLREGVRLSSKAIVLATGTFLNGRVLIGSQSYSAGRSGEPPSIALAKSLANLGLDMRRMNTGTTPRVNCHSINYERLERQDTSELPLCFSFWNKPQVLSNNQPVYMTCTNVRTHGIVSRNLQLSPNYNGLIGGEGPRHCPSLEAKIVKFPSRNSHKVFLEPEGCQSAEVYLQGIYTAFPPEIQEEIVHSIAGLEDAQIERYGYDIEYDMVDPRQLNASLEVDDVAGLYIAGQINGTTGYEEAAGQGLLAGINSARNVLGKDPVILSRDNSFIGVMIDDLVSKGVTEPYRMLPSRAEYRITLREGNADIRLSAVGQKIGLLSNEQYEKVRSKSEAIDCVLKELEEKRIGPNDPLNQTLTDLGTSKLSNNGASLYELLKRPQVRLEHLPVGESYEQEVREEAEIRVKYEGYLARHKREMAQMGKLEKMSIPENWDYSQLTSVSIEGRDLLDHVRPRTFGQATRMPSLSRSDLSMLAMYLRRQSIP